MTPFVKSAVAFTSLAAAAFASASAGKASIIGDTLSLDYRVPNSTTVDGSFTATPNPFIAGSITIGDLEGVTTLTPSFSTTGTTDTLTYLINTTLSDPTLNSASFNGPVLTVLSGNPFGSVLSVNGLVNDPSLVFDTGSMVGLNLAGVSYRDGDFVSITFGVSAVPLPPALPMFGAALLALGAAGFAMTRREKAVAVAA